MMRDLFESVKTIPTTDVFRAFFPTVELKRDGGGREKALCLFHVEDTPSLTLYENGFKCYGCGATGSNIDLVLKGNLAPSPLDAAKLIAERFGIPVEKRKPRKQKPLTLAQYASYVKVPQDFLCKSFHIEETPKGISFPYQDENGNQIGVQLRHRLEKGKGKDNRFSWQKGSQLYLYGAWAILRWKEKGTQQILLCEGASDVQVCWHNGVPALGVPGASVFRKEWLSPLLDFPELVIIQEPGEAGGEFVNRITTALKEADYRGQVKALCLPEKDPRDLWLKHGEKFNDELETAIAKTPAIDLYPKIPLTSDLILKVSELLSRHIFFKDKRLPLLIATWVLGTYIYDVFSFFGYLWVNSPSKRCAKSLLLDILRWLCWHSTSRLTNPTEAVIFRLADSGRTLILDELEQLRAQDREKYGAVMSVLNDGFHEGGRVARAERIKGKWVVIEYNNYCPKALAGISSLLDTIEDRCFKVPMVRKTKREKVTRFNLRKQAKALTALREEMSLWAEARKQAITELYDGIEEIPELASLDDRLKDISEPLVAIATYADAEAADGQPRVLSDLLLLVSDMAGTRKESERRETIVAFVPLAEEILGSKQQVFVPSEELLSEVRGVDELSWIGSTKALATILGRFDLTSTKGRVDPDKGQVRGYLLTRAWIEEMMGRYVPKEPMSEQDAPPSEGDKMGE